MSRDEMKVLQSRRLQKLVDRVYNRVPHYRTKMMEAGVEPGDIKSVEDIVKLPFTTKQDLRDTYPFGMFAVDMDEITRIHASSGTTGKQTICWLHYKNIDNWAECMAPQSGRRRASKVHGPCCIWLWSFHRRSWCALWS